jgi:NADH-quinone oxidoreductase subunit F
LAEERIILALEGKENSRSLATYKASGGYTALAKALKMDRKEIIEEVKKSGLRGRGGAGFPTGLKWSFVPPDDGKPKYLICNNDESEPGTFKDRHICTVTPHSIIEGMIIGAYAIGAGKGYIYTRWEFQSEIGYLEEAIKEAYEAGYLGKNILGSGLDFDLDHYSGAGAYICGEETGLISSLEGKKGQPKLKPPFPAVEGYLHRPTIVNNTETFCNIPLIVNEGADTFRKFGTEKSAGTKLFSISGALNKPGVFEVPMGYPLKRLIEEECQGMRSGKKIKAVVPGGMSAPLLLPSEVEQAKLDFEWMAEAGTMLGSGAIMVIDDDQDIVEMLRITVDFFAHESCGQCTPCREGTGWLKNIVDGIEHFKGDAASVDRLHSIASHMGGRTICALSDAAAMPTKSYVEKFGDEIKAYLERGQ